MDWLAWFFRFENTKPLALVLFFFAFCLILWYVFGDRKRGERLETYKHMPFMDEDHEKEPKS